MQIGFTETVLRDANQSIIATKLPLYSFEEILSEMDTTGYYSVECWGGATFDSCIRYLEEDPWHRLKTIRKYMPKTKLQMLLRGQSLLGYKHYSDDVVRKFVCNSVEKGIDIIRIFDALNDLSNIEVAVDQTLKCGAHPSCAISYTVSPVHNIESYISIAKSMEAMGAMSICIKDMSGILSPSVAYELISQLKANISVPIILHSHCSTGFAYMTYLKAIEAGVDVIDTAVSSFSGGTSLPATETLACIAENYGRESTLNLDKLDKINNHFERVMEENLCNGILDPKVMFTRPKTLQNQIPGGMYSNLLTQLKSQNIENRINEVLSEVVDVRKDLGYPPLVTPVSQMVGTQSVMNVILGKRYEIVLEEVKAYFRGEYGIPPGNVNQELMYSLVGKSSFEHKRYSKDLPDMYEIKKESLKQKGYGCSDILTSILFPDIGDSFIERRNNERTNSYTYNFMKCDKGVDTTNWTDITKTINDEIRALLTVILAYNLQSSAEQLNVISIYKVEE